MVKMRELGAKAEPMSQRAEVESRTRRLEAETGDHHAWAELETGSPVADQSAEMVLAEGELRD